MATDQIYQDYVDVRIERLNQLLEEPNNILQVSVNRAINETLTNQELERLLSVINFQYDQIQTILHSFAAQVIPGAYSSGADAGASILSQYGKAVFRNTRDYKAINILIRDMQSDFTRAIDGGRVNIGTYFKFSKQGRITESDISEAVARGLIDGGTGRDAKRLVRKAITEGGQNIFDQSSLDRYVKRKLNQELKRIDEFNVNDGLREYLKESFEEKLSQGKFMQIINKNGDVMNFQVKTYSDLVSRTRIGDAQVAGIIDNAHENGVAEFKVTNHHTTSKICIPHEGKIYTTDRKNKKYPFLSEDNKPLYHINCLHRLMPYVEVD